MSSSNLIDDRSRRRASLFYKAAFYDRNAFINIWPRYTTYTAHTLNYDEVGYDEWRKSPCVGYVEDCGVVIYSTEPKPSFENYCEQDKVEDAIKEELENYMAEHYPDYKDSHAYWD